MSGVATTLEARLSTTTVLGAGETWTGDAVEMTTWASASVFVYSDADSTPEGLQLQHSVDGVEWDRKCKYSYSRNEAITLGADLKSRYFRVVYTNGSAAQGEFRLQTIFHPTRQAALFTNDPSQFIPVRITDGSEFQDGQPYDIDEVRTLEVLENLLMQSRLTNLYLSDMVGERFFEHDLDITEED